MAQSDLTKRALAESMKQLMRENTVEKITVEEILADAKVSRRSFYRYFNDKFELLEWIYDQDFCQWVMVRPEKSLWDYYPEICEYLYRDRHFFAHAFSYRGQNSFRAFCFEKLFPLIMNDFGAVFSDQAIARFAVRRYVYAGFDGFVWWLSQEPCMPWQDYVKLSMDVIRTTADGIVRSFQK